jgi:hypothetical protein
VRQLDLNDEEARELAVALEAQTHILRVELTSADLRDFKAGLRARLELLERLTARLAESPEPARRQS